MGSVDELMSYTNNSSNKHILKEFNWKIHINLHFFPYYNDYITNFFVQTNRYHFYTNSQNKVYVESFSFGEP